MNINRIENKELRNFIERKPEASFKDIIDFCMQKFDDAMSELASSETKRLLAELSNDDLNKSPSQFEDIIQPFVKENKNRLYYNRLQDRAIQMTRRVMRDVETLSDSHSTEFINSLKNVVHSEFDDLRMTTPNRRTDLDSIYKDTNRRMHDRKETQDSNDKRKANAISDYASYEQKGIRDDFLELSTAEQQNYGFTFEGSRGSRRVVPIKRVFDGVKSKIEQLDSLFKSTKVFLDYDMVSTLIHDNIRILDEVQSTVRECRSIIDEAVYQISKEQIEEELHTDAQRREDIRKKLEEEDRALEVRRAEQKKEEEQYMARIQSKHESELYSNDSTIEAQGTSEDFSDIDFQFDKDIVLIDPSPETYQILTEAGMHRECVPMYIWDRFVRSSNLDKKLKNGEITQEEYEQGLANIQTIEETLFDQLVAGVDFETARSTAENVLKNGQEHIPTEMEENFSYNFNNILISASDATRAVLVNAGLPENQVDAFVWDRFVRDSNLDSNLKNGKITQEEYDQQVRLIDRIEELLFDNLVEGKSIDVARAIAENMAVHESTVTIIPSPEAQKALEEAGLSSEDAKRYVWDRYVRMQLIDEAHLNGQITEAEKAEQIAKVDEIEAKLVAGLKSGKSFEDARRNAEISARKPAVLDIVENGNITMGQVQKANDFIHAEVKTRVTETKKNLDDYLLY